ncbi:MAG TPA: CDP-alcohol phosphatidyltransferase family protein [Candidatus Acidoferrales bacterium]|nr:CDP-alcohol phosphatidyltransferase family protein [Candidatus Acidoferrales bacterium]
MLRRFGPHAANLLTALRVVLTPVFVAAVLRADVARADGGLAVVCFAVVAASDVYDGRVARRWGSASDAGRMFDHLADIGFLLAALSAYARLGIAPWWVPAAVGASFGYYVIDSRWRAPAGVPNLIGSRIGHLGGVSNYVLVGILVCNNTAAAHLLSPATLERLYWLVPLYSAAAVAGRLATRLSAQREARFAIRVTPV